MGEILRGDNKVLKITLHAVLLFYSLPRVGEMFLALLQRDGSSSLAERRSHTESLARQLSGGVNR